MLRQRWPALLLFGSASLWAAELEPLHALHRIASDLRIVAPCVPAMPWTVAGEHGALLGRQDGHFEGWQWPVKLLSNFRVRAELADYAVPIDVNALAAQIEVTPAETTITYSHAAFTVRQHMFAARGSSAELGATALFEIQSARPLNLTFSFTPEMLAMWPAPNHGRPGAEWVKHGASGFYILHSDDPRFSGLVAMPRTQPGIMVPYQEHPQTYPLELKLSFDPRRDRGLIYPLLLGVEKNAGSTSTPADAARQIDEAASEMPQAFARTEDYYAHFFDRRLTAETPDTHLDDALRWAEISIDQAQVQYKGETGLIAGYYESADSARPGYAWFFGRDTLWTSYAINSYGDGALTRRALDFLFARQRDDGKIMHEFSQSADALDWKQTPYFYASADSTPLLVMAVADYVRVSGDLAYLKSHWPAVRKAWEFTRAHEADNGIYSNSEGTGWVESWPPGMPKQELYLASLDEQSALAISDLAHLCGDSQLAAQAKSKATGIAAKIESEFYLPSEKYYAFSRDGASHLDPTLSIYPAVAWWDGTFALNKAGPMLSRWASSEISADWGTRDISEHTSFYDPISYHQGSIWPLFTGWVSLAEYRAGRSLSGYAHLMQNAGLTWAQDLGSITELLSGQFFQPLGRSSSHQLWSSAMVISPLLRGLFGLDWDALHATLQLSPHLPAAWDHARLHNVPLGEKRVDLDYRRTGDGLHVTASNDPEVCLVAREQTPAPCVAHQHAVSLPADAVELSLPAELPAPGSETTQLKVLDQSQSGHQSKFTFAAQADSSYDLAVRLNRPHVTVVGGALGRNTVHVHFPPGSGYQTQTVTFNY